MNARAWIGAVNNVPLESRNLKTMGTVNVRPILALRAERLRTLYETQRPAPEAACREGDERFLRSPPASLRATPPGGRYQPSGKAGPAVSLDGMASHGGLQQPVERH